MSYDTTIGNTQRGIQAGRRSLIAHNTAMGAPRSTSTSKISCPSDVTFNDSTKGFRTTS